MTDYWQFLPTGQRNGGGEEEETMIESCKTRSTNPGICLQQKAI